MNYKEAIIKLLDDISNTHILKIIYQFVLNVRE